MCTFILSAKSLKKYTFSELNYELTSNAFEFLNQHIRTAGDGKAEDVNHWLMQVLHRAKEIDKKVIKRNDIETIIRSINIEEENRAVESEPGRISEFDAVCVSSCESEIRAVDHQEIHLNKTDTSSRFIEITQLPPMSRSESIKELEDEIERLKMIIQIILNKQAELV